MMHLILGTLKQWGQEAKENLTMALSKNDNCLSSCCIHKLWQRIQ